jgi:hypothetical protein
MQIDRIPLKQIGERHRIGWEEFSYGNIVMDDMV